MIAAARNFWAVQLLLWAWPNAATGVPRPRRQWENALSAYRTSRKLGCQAATVALSIVAPLLPILIFGAKEAAAATPLVTAVAAWGSNESGQTDVPADLTGVTAVAAGDTQTLALKSDGTVVTWGQNLYSCQYPYGGCPADIPPAAASNVIAIAASRDTNLVLRADGTIYGWGYGYERTPPSGLTGVTAIATGPYLGAALRNDGTVVTWGLTDYGQDEFATGLTGAKAIAVGEFHALAVKADGSVVGSGGMKNADSPAAHPPAGLSGVTAVAAGARHSLALKSDGTVVGWGGNVYGEATPPAGLTGVTAIAAGGNQSFALKSDGTLVSWGASRGHQPNVPPGLKGVIAIAAGANHAVAVSKSALPSAPTLVSADSTGTAPLVSWKPPTFLGIGGVIGYTVTAQPGNFRIRLRSTARNYRLSRIDGRRPFVVTVTAITAAGSGSAASVRVAKNAVMTFQPSSATWLRPGLAPIRFGRRNDRAVPADYDGDGTTDFAVFRDGTWYVRGMASVQFGQRGDIPVPGDYNGDGKADFAVFRPATGTWYIRGASSSRLGARGDIPVPADYDGDGRTDIAVFRPANGVWYISTPGRASYTVQRYGGRGDIPVPGDYNGDGVTEVSVYRSRSATWYPGGRSSGIRFGQRGDVPVPGDYNEDGSTDFAVFRPANGTWFVRGGAALHLGGRGYVPIPPPTSAS